jgi:hypothetical protein
LFFQVGHFIASGFQRRGLQWNLSCGLLSRNSRLHVQFLAPPPQPAHFSIAGVFDDGKAVAVFYWMFAAGGGNCALRFACAFTGLHIIKVEQKVEHKQEKSRLQLDLAR